MNWKKIIKQSEPKVLKQIEELQDSPLISALEMSISNSANADLDDMFDKVLNLLGAMAEVAAGTHDKDGNPIQ